MSSQSELILKNAEIILQTVDLSVLRGKTIMLTGASGLIGVHILACLQKARVCAKPRQVIALVNRDPQPYVRELLDYKEAELLKGDLTDIDFCKSLPVADFIIHTAGYGQPIRFMEDPIKTLKLNTQATFLLFEKLAPGGKFLFISTSEVYTGLKDPPFREAQIGQTNTDHPRSCYIEAKRCGEAIVNAYRSKGVDAKSARLASAYGPGIRGDDKRVISSFIQKGLEGKITLMDMGGARRAYCYVTDAVEIFLRVLLDGTESVYNVGSIQVKSIAELAGTIGALMHVPVIFPEHPQEVKGGPEEAWLDMEKAKTEFNKDSYVPLHEGLQTTIDWYKMQQT